MSINIAKHLGATAGGLFTGAAVIGSLVALASYEWMVSESPELKVGFGVNEVEWNGRKFDIDDLESSIHPELFVDGIQSTSQWAMALGIIGLLSQVLSFLGGYSQLLEKNDICGGCEGAVSQTSYLAAFFAGLCQGTAVVVYKTQFPNKDIYVEPTLDLGFSYYFMVASASLSFIGFAGYYYEANPEYFKGDSKLEKHFLAVPVAVFIAMVMCLVSLGTLRWTTPVDRPQDWFGLRLYFVNGTEYVLEDIDLDFPELPFDEIKTATQVALAFGIIACACGLLSIFAFFSLYTGKSEVCGCCQGSVAETSYMSLGICGGCMCMACIGFDVAFPFMTLLPEQYVYGWSFMLMCVAGVTISIISVVYAVTAREGGYKTLLQDAQPSLLYYPPAVAVAQMLAFAALSTMNWRESSITARPEDKFGLLKIVYNGKYMYLDDLREFDDTWWDDSIGTASNAALATGIIGCFAGTFAAFAGLSYALGKNSFFGYSICCIYDDRTAKLAMPLASLFAGVLYFLSCILYEIIFFPNDEFRLGMSFTLMMLAGISSSALGAYTYYIFRGAEEDERLKQLMPYFAVGAMVVVGVLVLIALSTMCWTIEARPCRGNTWGLLRKVINDTETDIKDSIDPRRLVEASHLTLGFGIVGLVALALAICAGCSFLSGSDECFQGYTTLALSGGLLVAGGSLALGSLLYLSMMPSSTLETVSGRTVRAGYSFILYIIAAALALFAGWNAYKHMKLKIPPFLRTKYQSSPRRRALFNGLVFLCGVLGAAGLCSNEWRISISNVNPVVSFGIIKAVVNGEDRFFMSINDGLLAPDVYAEATRASACALLFTFSGMVLDFGSCGCALFLWLGKCDARGHKACWLSAQLAGVCYFLAIVLYSGYWPVDMDPRLNFGYSFGLVATAMPLSFFSGVMLYKLEFTRTSIDSYLGVSQITRL